jgi:hypothetical protein
MWWLENRRTWAMFWYNWVGMPLAMLFQKRLKLMRGLIDTTGVAELLLVCRRGVRTEPRVASQRRPQDLATGAVVGSGGRPGMVGYGRT